MAALVFVGAMVSVTCLLPSGLGVCVTMGTGVRLAVREVMRIVGVAGMLVVNAPVVDHVSVACVDAAGLHAVKAPPITTISVMVRFRAFIFVHILSNNSLQN